MITIKLLEIYLIAFLCSLNWIFVWQTTTLKVKFLKFWLFLRRKKAMLFTPTDFEDYVYENWGLFGELLTCPICFAHWVGVIFSSILCYFMGGDWWIVPVCFFTFPVLIYFLIKKYI